MTRRRFHDSEYTPMRLRGLLRETLQPSERIVGWGTVTRASPAVETMLYSLMMSLPFLSAVFFTLLSSRKRVLILTDRRVLAVNAITGGEDPSVKHITLDEPITRVRVTRQSDRAFRVYLPHRPGRAGMQPRNVTVARSKAPPAKALAEGLGLIAEPAVVRDAEPTVVGPAPRTL